MHSFTNSRPVSQAAPRRFGRQLAAFPPRAHAGDTKPSKATEAFPDSGHRLSRPVRGALVVTRALSGTTITIEHSFHRRPQPPTFALSQKNSRDRDGGAVPGNTPTPRIPFARPSRTHRPPADGSIPSTMDDRIRSFTELARSTIHRGKKFDFQEVTLQTATGATITRQCVRHPGAVVLLPLLQTAQGPAVAFVRNERFSVGIALLELPAGTREPAEAPEVTAARELIEETGYRAATLTPLARFYTTPGMTDELMWAYLATGLSHVGARPEEDEALELVILPASVAFDAARRGELLDAKSILTILLAHAKGLLPLS